VRGTLVIRDVASLNAPTPLTSGAMSMCSRFTQSARAGERKPPPAEATGRVRPTPPHPPRAPRGAPTPGLPVGGWGQNPVLPAPDGAARGGVCPVWYGGSDSGPRPLIWSRGPAPTTKETGRWPVRSTAVHRRSR
jgi:hypothetical protein